MMNKQNINIYNYYSEKKNTHTLCNKHKKCEWYWSRNTAIKKWWHT